MGYTAKYLKYSYGMERIKNRNYIVNRYSYGLAEIQNGNYMPYALVCDCCMVYSPQISAIALMAVSTSSAVLKLPKENRIVPVG